MKHTFKAIVDSLTVPTFVIDMEHNIVAWNKACELLTGIDAADIIGTADAWRGFYPSERPCLADVVVDNTKEQLDKLYPIHGDSKFSQGLHAESWFNEINGQKRYLIFDAEPLYDDNGILIGALENLEDVTDIKQAELRGRTHSEVMSQLVKGESLANILKSLIDEIERDDPFARCSILLMDPSGKYLLTGAAPSLPDFYNQAVNGLQIGDGVGCCGTAAFTQKRVVVEDIQIHPFWEPYKELAAKANLASCWSEPIIGTDNKILGTFAIYHQEPKTPSTDDFQFIEFVSQLATIAIEQNHARQQQLLSSRVFNDTREGITITNSDGVIIDVNPAFCDITGYSREDILGKNPSILSSGKQSPEFYADMWKILGETGHWQGEVWNRTKDGELYAELLSISSLKNENDQVMNYVGIFTDITRSKKQQEELSLMAHYDVLTGLPNRALFVDRFQQAIAHSKRNKTLLAIIFLDLDKFKPVNDNYGHEVGDKLLIEVAKRIKANIREEDTVSRQGGDEFAILLGDVKSISESKKMAQRIHHSLSLPYSIDGHTISIGASSGIALYPLEDADLDTLIRHADQAMYQAKLTGRNRYHLFNHDDEHHAVQKQNELQEIEQALVNNNFQLYYQPKVNMRTGNPFGAEALIRWIHPKKGLIPPLDFLPAIEDTELEIKVGNWVINEALSQLEVWHQLDIRLEVSINISSHHLLSETFFTELDTALAKHPSVDSQCLQLEILESSALGDLNAISTIIEICQSALGIKVALDDFGTGYSSLTHLRNLPANTIKIDQSFVRDMLDDPSDSAIIDGILGLAEAFNREVIAEGVEATNHGLMLLMMGCEKAQGYGIAKPMPADDFPRWLANYTPCLEWQQCGNMHLSIKEKKVNLFRLVAERWKDRFIDNIQSSPDNAEHWPIMSSKHCPCGAWIKRVQQERLFENEGLMQLGTAHETLHRIAQALHLQYQDGDVSTAREGLLGLQAAFDDMNNAVEVGE